MTLHVTHDQQAHRFTVVVDGHECELDYALRDNVMTILHTSVPAAVGGQGIAAELTRVALDHARAQKWRVVPACSYVAAYVRSHPDYADLLA